MKNKIFFLPVLVAGTILVTSNCVLAQDKRQDASAYTQTTNNALSASLPFTDKQDFEDARKGFIAPLSAAALKTAKDQIIWDPEKFSFVENKTCPSTVNPSLWRQAQLVNIAGLFKVTDRIYQVRNYDLSNMTIIEGEKGIIIVDPLISVETARAALDLYYQHRPQAPVLNVIYSHSHVDHYAGVKGVTSEEDVKSGKVQIYAPEGFLEHAVSENLMAGNAMARRAGYMYGNLLPADARGQVGAGLGTTTSSGTGSLIVPSHSIKNETLKIDGLTFEFMSAPDSEAPAEIQWYIPELKALTAAENCVHTMHNIYSLRGARVRDPLAWSKYLQKTLIRWGNGAEVFYGMHHWPVWTNERTVELLSGQRDLYRYINDQTLRLANHGLSMTEIAEVLQLPEALANKWFNRGYYGSLNHNVKATYVKYLGFFDGNPATLHELPRTEAGKKYVEFMGGSDAVLKKARESFAKGEYRWVAQVLNHVIFAEPNNLDARELQANCLEQLGYQAESGPWRNFYLTGAQELRNGIAKLDCPVSGGADTLRAMDIEMLFDYMAMCLNAPHAGAKKIMVNFDITDSKQQYVLALANGVLNYIPDKQDKTADVSLTMDRMTLNALVLKKVDIQKALANGSLTITGDKTKFMDLLSLMDTFEFWFPLVAPAK